MSARTSEAFERHALTFRNGKRGRPRPAWVQAGRGRPRSQGRFTAWRAIGVMLVAVSLCIVGSARAEAPPATQKPAELKVLERLIGAWDSVSTVKVMDGQPVKLSQAGTVTRRWSLNGWFVEEAGKGENGMEVHVLFTYDVNSQRFKMWYFDSLGTNVDSDGTWDEASHTISWKKDLGNGITQLGTIHFVDPNAHEWTSAVKDGAGKVLWEGAGKVTRKK